MMTETEAKTKWCPFARVVTQTSLGEVIPSAGNKLVDADGAGQLKGSKCQGSACMAWRKRVHHENRDKREPEDERIGKYSADGYCGLAGRPE